MSVAQLTSLSARSRSLAAVDPLAAAPSVLRLVRLSLTFVVGAAGGYAVSKAWFEA